MRPVACAALICVCLANAVDALGVTIRCLEDRRGILVANDIYGKWTVYGDAATNGRELAIAAGPGSCHLMTDEQDRVSWRRGDLVVHEVKIDETTWRPVYMRDYQRFRQILSAIEEFEAAKSIAAHCVKRMAPGETVNAPAQFGRIDALSQSIARRLAELSASLKEVDTLI